LFHGTPAYQAALCVAKNAAFLSGLKSGKEDFGHEKGVSQ